jgi:hypothetical protein
MTPQIIKLAPGHFAVTIPGASVEIIWLGYSLTGDLIYEVAHGPRRTSWSAAVALACQMLESRP